MDSSTKHENKSPRLGANPISKLVFWWLYPLFKHGQNHDLEVKDLHNALPNDLSHVLGNKLERNWRKEEEAASRDGRKPKLFTAIRKTFALSYAYYGGWIFFLFMVLRILQPLTLGLLIWHFDPRSETSSEDAYLYASGVVVLSILMAFIHHHANLGQLEIGMRVRIACSSLLYRKILKLSRTAAGKTTAGQIVNLLSNDVARFEQVFIFLHFIWIMPLQGALIAYLIWRSVEIASLAGVFLVCIQTIPVQAYVGKLTTQLRGKIAVRTDERVRLMSEIIGGIKVIKMYNWEKPFEKIVSLARRYEVNVLTLTSYLRGFTRATYVFTERTTLYFTLMAYVLLGNDISAVKVFTMAQYFNIMQFTIAILYPMALSSGAEALVSIRRLEEFLLLEEKVLQGVEQQQKLQQQRDLSIETGPLLEKTEKAITEGETEHQERKNGRVNNLADSFGASIKQVSASWVENSISNTLHDINITVAPGELCALVGPVGAGKSSLLQLLLGELEAKQGRVKVNGVVSYASQEPWLFPGSVRNNILFGLPYEEARYRRVTKVCALIKDFVQLPQGDKTRVGERGVTLSGGQRARINLARAVYREADIYLLDDPLSAVDTHVGKKLFEDCIQGYLGKKTRILVTHQVQYLNNCDKIVMIANGVILKQGTYTEFRDSDLEVVKSITSDPETEEKDKQKAKEDSPDEESDSRISECRGEKEEEEAPETEELMAKGAMLRSVYWKYFSAGNSLLVIIGFLLVTILGQLGSSGTDYWVTHWTNHEEMKLREALVEERRWNDSSLDNSTLEVNATSGENTTRAEDITMVRIDQAYNLDRDTALWIYGGFVIASVVMTSARNLMFYKMCMNSSRDLHNRMFSCLLKAPMRFFDTNPSGRILNRFSKDVGSVDEILPTTMIDSLQIFAVMVGILGQVVIISWWTIFPIMIMGFFYGRIRKFYLSTAQDLKRLEGVAKSPVFSHVNSTLSGLDTIRSAGRQKILRTEFDSHQNLHTGAYFLGIASSSAFGLWLDFVTVGFVACVTYSFVILNDGTTFAGNVGLAISQILILCGMMPHGMRQTAETVAQMTGVERILQFTELDKEGPFESEPGKKPPSTWPAKGEIKFEHVFLRYDADEAPVLKDFNISLESGMKLGVVGRTGAGKSSLIAALFNLAKIDGDIFIDGVNTKEIGLDDLRSKISIIPQEPVLFSATLRDNLDPFARYEDAVLWAALEQVQLKAAVSSLEHIVTQGGTNFSAGQRQLLCLARAIVANNKILILDEATANVDPATDQLIQSTIRKEFKECTVLTIAHRLNTIMDSDKVLVIDDGRVQEFDHPHILLQNKEGFFTKMVGQTGEAMAERLIGISKQAYERSMAESAVVEPEDN